MLSDMRSKPNMTVSDIGTITLLQQELAAKQYIPDHCSQYTLMSLGKNIPWQVKASLEMPAVLCNFVITFSEPLLSKTKKVH